MNPAILHNPIKGPPPRIAAMILAAGYSSRMGQFKPLLPIGSSTAFETVVRLFHSAGITDVYAVLGHRANELEPVAEAGGVRSIINPHFDTGMYSSVCVGAAALPTTVDACFVIPVDIPLVRASTIRQLGHFYAAAGRAIVYPTFQQQRGHPPLVSHAILAETRESTHNKLSSLLAAHEREACNLEVADEGIHRDMDTPDEFLNMSDFAARRGMPSIGECAAIMAIHRVKASVINHSHVVAGVAQRIAIALAGRGDDINPHLAWAGGLLHDLAKGNPSHAAVGAAILRDLDFYSVADVVASHTSFDFSGAHLDEAAIVYLADKMVSGEQIVGVEHRFCLALVRSHDNPEALKAVLIRRGTAEAIQRAVEARLGMELIKVVSGSGDLG